MHRIMPLLAFAAILAPLRLPAQTIDRHGAPSVACNADGGFVVVWQSRGQDGDGYGVIAQRFDSSGGRSGSEFIVNTYTTDDQMAAAVCADDAARFVVVWQSYGQDDDGDGVFARRFDSSGAPLGVEFQVSTALLYSQSEADVACAAAGDFVVAWSSGNSNESGYDIVARRFTSDGSSQGSDFIVNASTSTSQVTPSVAADGTGGFVVAWTSDDDQDGDAYGIFGQRYSNTGTTIGSEFQINAYTTNSQRAPAIAAKTDGSFVVAWSSSQGAAPDDDVFTQSFASDGTRVGGELMVNTYTTGNQGLSFGSGRVLDVASSADDAFVIVWQSTDLLTPTQDGDGSGVFAQRYSGSPPTAVGTEFRANSATAGDQSYPSVCATGPGAFVVVWESHGPSVDGIFAQRYDSSGGPLGPEIHVNSDTARGTAPCPGDCDGSRRVSIDELVRGVNIALGQRPVSECPPFDFNRSDTVTVDELVTAVRAAVEGCPSAATPTPEPTATPPADPERTRRSLTTHAEKRNR